MSNQSVRYSVTYKGMILGPVYDKAGYALQAGVTLLNKLEQTHGEHSVTLWEHRRPHGQLKEVVTQFCVISL